MNQDILTQSLLSILKVPNLLLYMYSYRVTLQVLGQRRQHFEPFDKPWFFCIQKYFMLTPWMVFMVTHQRDPHPQHTTIITYINNSGKAFENTYCLSTDIVRHKLAYCYLLFEKHKCLSLIHIKSAFYPNLIINQIAQFTRVTPGILQQLYMDGKHILFN